MNNHNEIIIEVVQRDNDSTVVRIYNIYTKEFSDCLNNLGIKHKVDTIPFREQIAGEANVFSPYRKMGYHLVTVQNANQIDAIIREFKDSIGAIS